MKKNLLVLLIIGFILVTSTQTIAQANSTQNITSEQTKESIKLSDEEKLDLISGKMTFKEFEKKRPDFVKAKNEADSKISDATSQIQKPKIQKLKI